jgi:hypothetical protein
MSDLIFNLPENVVVMDKEKKNKIEFSNSGFDQFFGK